MKRRTFLLAASAGVQSLLLADQSDQRVYTYTEDLTWFGNRKDPDNFHLAHLGILLVEKNLLYWGRKIALPTSDFLYVDSDLGHFDKNKVYQTEDGSYVFYLRRRYFNEMQARAWRKHLVDYRNNTDLLPHYSVDAALLFAGWVIRNEALTPWVGLAVNALGIWEFAVNLINDRKHMKAVDHMIDTVCPESFIFTRLDLKPGEPQNCQLSVFYQNSSKEDAIPLWARPYHLLHGVTEPVELIDGWS